MPVMVASPPQTPPTQRSFSERRSVLTDPSAIDAVDPDDGPGSDSNRALAV